jgi:hypothetical protein
MRPHRFFDDRFMGWLTLLFLAAAVLLRLARVL